MEIICNKRELLDEMLNLIPSINKVEKIINKVNDINYYNYQEELLIHVNEILEKLNTTPFNYLVDSIEEWNINLDILSNELDNHNIIVECSYAKKIIMKCINYCLPLISIEEINKRRDVR